MGTNTLTDYSTGNTISTAVTNDIHTALKQDFVPRNSVGAPANIAGDLGQSALRWKKLWCQSIDLNGEIIDLNEIVTQKFKVISGREGSASNAARYLDPIGAGGAGNGHIRAGGGNPNLVVVINNLEVTRTSDISISGLTLAPGSNNTCLINDTSVADQYLTQLLGEKTIVISNNFRPRVITIDTVGTEISSRVGQWHFFSLNNGSTTEVLFGRILSSTQIAAVSRGVGYDTGDVEQLRIICADNDQITLLMGNWIFLADDGASTFTTTLRPIYGGNQPTSPATGQYWFDYTVEFWKRFNGATWDDHDDRILLGVLICNNVDCLYAISWPFFFRPDDFNTLSPFRFSNTIALSRNNQDGVSVWGKRFDFHNSEFTWDMATDIEFGFAEAASTIYYLYVTDEGKPKISPTIPRTKNWMAGEYHPQKPWRALGLAFNDVSSNFEVAGGFIGQSKIRVKTENGRGSTNTARQRFSTISTRYGDILYTDSATAGAQWEILRAGIYQVVYKTNKRSPASEELKLAISKDGVSGTSFDMNNDDDYLSVLSIEGISSDTAQPGTVSWGGPLFPGQRIYPQVDPNTPDGATNTSFFEISKVRDFEHLEEHQ